MTDSPRMRTVRVILDWFDALDGTEPADELAARVRDIEELIPTLGLLRDENTEISQELIHANASLLSGWEDE